jgi:hypothetical protein
LKKQHKGGLEMVESMEDLMVWKEPEKPVCKGIVCRASKYVGVHYQKNGRTCIVDKIQLNILKRKSCSGCEQCAGLWGQLSEVNNDWPIKNMGDVEDGKLYYLTIEVLSTDWESGLPDEWEFVVKELKETPEIDIDKSEK